MAKKIDEVIICACGHERELHADRGKGFCKEYVYNGFENKCTCQSFNAFMKLDRDEDIIECTDAIDQDNLETI